MIAVTDEDMAALGRAGRAVRLYDRGTITGDELASELLDALEPWDPDMRAHAVEVMALLAHAGAPTPVLRYAYLFADPATMQALDPLVDLELADAEEEPEIPDPLASLAITVVERRALPESFLRSVADRGTPGLASLISLLDALREGDRDRTVALISDAARRGCIGPLRRAAAYEPPALSPPEILDVLDRFDVDNLCAEGRWGTLAAGAALAARHTSPGVALTWSAAVDDARLIDGGPPIGGDPHGWECDSACSMTASQLLGVLAAVDWVSGERARAIRRASGVPERERLKAFSEVERALARWVLAQAAPPLDRPALLDGIKSPHSWLGLLKAQIEQDLADLAEDPERVDERERGRALGLARPQPRPYFGSFEFEDVLWALPVGRRYGEAPTAPPSAATGAQGHSAPE